jgi:hypothetical protein
LIHHEGKGHEEKTKKDDPQMSQIGADEKKRRKVRIEII